MPLPEAAESPADSPPPYAKSEPDGGDINYIRNSVKIVIDAYNGTVTFYVMDAADPIIATYRRIFPSLFKPFDAMPPDLQKHIRYPEDLFYIQALQYRAYHMDVPEVFYNREDLWQFPREPVAPDETGAGGETRMAPYYIMMRLPGEPNTEFFLMLPMTPSRRENMIAWLAARCDLPEYGKQKKACDLIMPDFMRIGGVTGFLRSAAAYQGARD
jgi:hypothetical protein